MKFRKQRLKVVNEIDVAYELLANETLVFKFDLSKHPRIKFFNIKPLDNRQDNSMMAWFSERTPYYNNIKFDNDLTHRNVSQIVGLIIGIKARNTKNDTENPQLRANRIVVEGKNNEYYLNIENMEGRPQQLAIEEFRNY